MIRFRTSEPWPVKMRVTDAVIADLREVYAGPYEVTPATNAQTLQTEGKSMERSVTVHAVPYAEVSNTAGGKTIIIGG